VTIGGVDVKLSDVTYAYSVLAADGLMRGVPATGHVADGERTLNPVTILKVERADGKVLYPSTSDHQVHVEERRVIEPQYAYMINNILSDGNNFCLTYGCNALSIGRQWAVKTGTSEPFENSTAIGDTWTYGYTPDLVTGAWFGNADNSPMFNITSTSVSYRTVRDFMVQALADTPATKFQRPDGLVETDVCEPSGLKATSACGRVVKNELPKDKVPARSDDWWREVRIDKRNGLLATDRTPAEFVEVRRTFVIPGGVQGFARSQAEEWARILGVGLLPTQESPDDTPTAISETTPAANMTTTPVSRGTPAATAPPASPTRPPRQPTAPPTVAAQTPTAVATPTP
jgi:membrane peptidoglycan carboxypeptidase